MCSLYNVPDICVPCICVQLPIDHQRLEVLSKSYVCAYVYICVYMYIHIHICTYKCTYIHTYTHTHTHRYTPHTHTHTTHTHHTHTHHTHTHHTQSELFDVSGPDSLWTQVAFFSLLPTAWTSLRGTCQRPMTTLILMINVLKIHLQVDFFFDHFSP